MNLMRQLWQDEAGVIVSTEIILVLMILVFGLIAGMVSLRDAVTQELADTGLMVNELNQSYSFTGNQNTAGAAGVNAQTPSSVFADNTDINDGGDTAATLPAGVSISAPAGAIE